MIGIKEHEELFRLVGESLKKQVECMAIGGSAMLFHGLKSATKDVDIVFFSENEREGFVKALMEAGFSRKITVSGKPGKGIPFVMEGMDTKFDLFLWSVFQFTISPDMRGRVEQKHEFGNLVVGVASNEDIILLKSVTDREGDRIDAKNIIDKFELSWERIIAESQWQTSHGDRTFTVHLFDFFEELYDSGAKIPKDVMRKVRKISRDEMLRVLGSGKGNIRER